MIGLNSHEPKLLYLSTARIRAKHNHTELQLNDLLSTARIRAKQKEKN